MPQGTGGKRLWKRELSEKPVCKRLCLDTAAFICWKYLYRKPVFFLNSYLDAGGNYIETAASYGNGESERKIGRSVARRRGDYVLVTKTGERGQAGLSGFARAKPGQPADRLCRCAADARRGHAGTTWPPSSGRTALWKAPKRRFATARPALSASPCTGSPMC